MGPVTRRRRRAFPRPKMAVVPIAGGTRRLRALALRQLPALVLAGIAVVLFSDRLRGLDTAAILDALGRVSPAGAGAAAGLAALSFAAVARYDVLVHRLLATGQDAAAARRAGFAATAISQTTGFGLVVGTLVRLRLMPGLSLQLAAAITAAAALLFLAGWSVVTAAAVVALPSEATRHLAPLALAILAAVPLMLAASLLSPEPRLGRRSLRLPPPGVLLALVGLAAIDTVAAGLCLWSLLPPDAAVLLPALLPAFLLAYGAGLVSGAPGGIGAFEVTLLALLPDTPAEPLFAGLLAWRVVYHAGPAIVGAFPLFRNPAVPHADAATAARPVPTAACGELPAATARILAGAERAEFGLARQSDKAVLPCGSGGTVVARAGHTLAMIGPPSGPRCETAAIDALEGAARAEARRPCLYKAPPRLAAVARARGWAVAPVALEAVLDPQAFDLSLPRFRQLRRKLKRAAGADVEVRCMHPDTLDWTATDRIAADWAVAHGGERGFSMGRYTRGYMRGQRIYVASRGDETLGFVTLHEGRTEWTLDLMRARATAPDGTMHALVAAAIRDARVAGLRRLSLAAVPHPALAGHLERVARWLRRADTSRGLTRFKEAFAPRWAILHVAAPTRVSLMLASVDLIRAIHLPQPLPVRHACPPPLQTETEPSPVAVLATSLTPTARPDAA